MSDGSDEKTRQPPYAKYAFRNPYNLAILGGFASAAVLTGNWWLGLAGAGAEAIWMLFAPDSKLLRKAWFDKLWAAELDEQKRAELEKKFKALPEADQMRCIALRDQQEQIRKMATENPSFATDLLQGELAKLDGLVRSFVELQLACAKYGEYLRTVDLDEIERDTRRYQQIIDHSTGDKRELAQKNLKVVLARKERCADIRNQQSTARGQLELIENTFRLLADQIVTMRSPAELGGQLDELRDGVEAARQTARETEKLLQGGSLS